jgi:hypothetical protein
VQSQIGGFGAAGSLNPSGQCATIYSGRVPCRPTREASVKSRVLEVQVHPKSVAIPPCRHCQRNSAYKPGGLCSRCYYTVAVRVRYGGLQELGRGTRDGYKSPVGRVAPKDLPSQPTSALPGTPEKVEVLRERARAGVSLWHPLDAPMDPREREGV